MISSNKTTNDTQKQIATIMKGFQPTDEYLQQRKQLKDAIRALQAKKVKADNERNASLKRAGLLEAKRLMGEVTADEAQALDVNFTILRDEQDRLSAAEEALSLQQQALDERFEKHQSETYHGIAMVRDILLQELETDLMSAAQHVSSILNRLHVLSLAVDLKDSSYADVVSKIAIPSLLENTNLVTTPYRLHPRDNSLMDEAWEEDAEALAWEQLLRPLSLTRHKMRDLERDLEAQHRHAMQAA